MLSQVDLFVSHSSQDRGVAAAVCDALHAYGVSTWFSSGHSKIESGEIWAKRVVEALTTGDQFLLILSEESLRSDNVKDEVELAIRLKKQIFVLSLHESAETEKLIRLSAMPYLEDVVILFAQSLRRTESVDRYDACAREISSSLRRRSKDGSLKLLAGICLVSCLIVYSGGLWLQASEGLTGVRDQISAWWNKSDKSMVSPPKRGTERVAVAAVSPSAKSAAVAAVPSRPQGEKGFVAPRFMASPSLPIQSRLLGQWTASQDNRSMVFNLKHDGESFLGTVMIKGGGKSCLLNVKSERSKEISIVFKVLPGPEACAIKNLHLGYKNDEKVQVVVEGGAYGSQSFYRDL